MGRHWQIKEDRRFLSTLSLRRATGNGGAVICSADISIHALLAESDGLPCRGSCDGQHFYPRSPCGERRQQFHRRLLAQEISIHALLAESDAVQPRQGPAD